MNGYKIVIHIYHQSIYSLLNALDEYPYIDYKNWLLLVKNQHEASYLESKRIILNNQVL